MTDKANGDLSRIVGDWSLSQRTRSQARDEQRKRGLLQCSYMHRGQQCDREQHHTVEDRDLIVGMRNALQALIEAAQRDIDHGWQQSPQ